ncbi:hypothetical protein GCM10020331_064770 [Ectobacillus funiculus]
MLAWSANDVRERCADWLHYIFLRTDKQACLRLVVMENFLDCRWEVSLPFFQEVRDAVLQEGVSLETALQVITSNTSHVLRLPDKGYVKEGKDADIVLLDKHTLQIGSVFARGRLMVEGGTPVVKGTFER